MAYVVAAWALAHRMRVREVADVLDPVLRRLGPLRRRLARS